MWFLNKHLPWINAASTSRTSVVAHLFLCLFICPFCCSFLFCFVLLVVCLFVFKLTNSISYSVNSAKESATFWIRFPEWKFLNTLWIRNRVDAKSGSSPVLYREYCIQDGNLDACRVVMSLKLSEFKVRPCQNSYHQPVTVQIRFTNPDFEIMISWKTSPASKSYGSSFFTALLFIFEITLEYLQLPPRSAPEQYLIISNNADWY